MKDDDDIANLAAECWREYADFEHAGYDGPYCLSEMRADYLEGFADGFALGLIGASMATSDDPDDEDQDDDYDDRLYHENMGIPYPPDATALGEDFPESGEDQVHPFVD